MFGRQATWFLVGLPLLVLATRLPVRVWRALAYPALMHSDLPGVPMTVLRTAYQAGTPDSRIVPPGIMKAVDELRPLLADQECVSVLVPSAVWYYLFDKASCSKFHVLPYASAPVAQDEMVRELEAATPLYVVRAAPADEVDWGDMARKLPTVFAYVDSHYRSFAESGGLSIWRRIR